MTPAIRVVLIAIATVVVVSGMVASVRWAKRGGAAAAGAVMLALGSIFVGKPPSAHYIEHLREDKGKKGNESGEPPET
jgi:hypothetical protein